MLDLPKLSVDPVLFLPLWLGTLRDASGYGNHGTNTGGHWRNSGGVDGFRDGEINIGADSSLDPTDITIFAWGDFRSQITNEYFFTTDDLSTRFYMTATALRFVTGGVNSARNVMVVPARSIAVVATGASAAPLFYVDGALDGAGALATQLSIGSHPVVVCGLTATEVKSPIAGYAIYPGALDADEIALLDAYGDAVITPRHQWPGAGLTTGDPKYLDNIQTARVNLATDTSGQLSNTGLSIITGQFAVTESAAGRAITCVSAGKLRRHLVGADGFTTQLFTETGGATITKNASNFEIDAGNGDTITAIQLVA